MTSLLLSFVSDDLNDLEPLTLNHLLQLKVQSILVPGLLEKKNRYARRWHKTCLISSAFLSGSTANAAKSYIP